MIAILSIVAALQGEKIDPHGREFGQVCRQIVTHRPGYFCGEF